MSLRNNDLFHFVTQIMSIEAMSKSSTQVNNASYTVNAPIDKIVLQNVQDPDGFAKALYENFSLVMAQQFSKFKF